MRIKDLTKNIMKSTNACAIKDSIFANINGYLDTGSMAINRVITGDIHKGFPKGRISTIFGLSQSGKSLIAAQTLITAFQNNEIDTAFIFDSEGGSLINTFENAGVDMEKIIHVPVGSIEECGVQMMKTYDELVKAKEEYLADPDNNDDVRVLCILDSLGALKSEKIINDAVKKDQMVQDMGLTAKMKNNLMNVLMMKVVKSGATLLVINHEFQDPAAMFASKIHNMGGGKGVEFASHVILQAEKTMVKSDNTEFLTGNESSNDNVGFYKGNKMKFFTTKNRCAKPCFQAEVFIDFTSGVSKYDGLISDAIKFGYIEKVHGGYICKSYSDKKITYKTLVSTPEVWNTFIEDFNKKSIEMMSYSNNTSRLLENINTDTETSEEED